MGWERGGHLGVGDALVLPDLLGDAGAELGGGHDVVEVVDLHDGGDGAAGLPEEVEHAVPRLPHRRRVRRNLHRAHGERHLFALTPLRRLSPAAALSLAARPQVAPPLGGGGGGGMRGSSVLSAWQNVLLPIAGRPDTSTFRGCRWAT